jgi:hypothetical protein
MHPTSGFRHRPKNNAKVQQASPIKFRTRDLGTDAAIASGGIRKTNCLVDWEIRVQGDIQEATLTLCCNFWKPDDLMELAVFVPAKTSGSLCDQHFVVGQESDSPGMLESRNHGGRTERNFLTLK